MHDSVPLAASPSRPLCLLMGLLVGLSTLVACGGEENAAATGVVVPPLPETPKGLEGVALHIPEDNPLTAEKAALGKLLFFDPRLSSDGSMSCSTCHLPHQGWTDWKQFSTKVDGTVNTRNSPTMYNVGYQSTHFYWDGRAPSMEANVMAAWKGHMGGDPEAMSAALAKIPEYAERFAGAYEGEKPINGDNIVKALTSFVRTIRSGNSAYDRGEMSEAAKRGEESFTARCAVCHIPPLFTDLTFHNIGVGEKPDVGRGKFDEDLPGAFKTPHLRDVTKTGPYFHDGSVVALRDAVRIMATGGVDNPNLDPVLKAMASTHGEPDEAEIDDLLAFLTALESKIEFEMPVLPK